MCYRTPFEQNTFYNSIKSYLPSGVNDYQVKLRRKTSLPLLHAGLQSGTTTRTAWKELNKVSRIISNSDTIKFHTVTTSFTRL